MNENGNGVLALRQHGQVAEIQRSAGDVVSMTRLVAEVMNAVMQHGQHYGTIPGCGDKPALLKPGAEKLCVTFRLAAMPEVTTVEMGNGHREYRVLCKLVHIPTGETWGVGVGCCSTMESKYRWRGGGRKCPQCGKGAIIKGKAEYGGGYICFGKKGGCGAKFQDGDRTIEGQSEERQENPDIADQYNTVLKMAKKRAIVDATLTATAASDIFTQDIEELLDTEGRIVGESAPLQPQRPVPEPPAPTEKKAPTNRSRVRDEVATWSGMKGNDLADACKNVIAKAGIEANGKPITEEQATTVLAWIEANRTTDFLEAIK